MDGILLQNLAVESNSTYLSVRFFFFFSPLATGKVVSRKWKLQLPSAKVSQCHAMLPNKFCKMQVTKSVTCCELESQFYVELFGLLVAQKWKKEDNQMRAKHLYNHPFTEFALFYQFFCKPVTLTIMPCIPMEDSHLTSPFTPRSISITTRVEKFANVCRWFRRFQWT